MNYLYHNGKHHSKRIQSTSTWLTPFNDITTLWIPCFKPDRDAFTLRQWLLAGIFSSAITGPSELFKCICKTPPVLDTAFTLTDLNFFFPKSTLLYWIHPFDLLKIVFHPRNLLVVSIKSTATPSPLLLVKRSSCISLVASDNPTPLNVGITFLIVPSALKNKLSALTDLALSKFGE